MKKKIETEDTCLPMEVRSAVEVWETRRNQKVLRNISKGRLGPDRLDPAYQGIQFLVRKGCTAGDIIRVLDWLRAYGSNSILASAKRKRELWLDRANRLVLRLRRDAKDAEGLLEFIRSRTRPEPQLQASLNAPRSPEESDSDSDQASPTGIPTPASPVQANSSDLSFILAPNLEEPELWDVMLAYADNLDSYVKMQQGYNYRRERRTDADLGFLAEEFTRRFSGTLFYLVLAAELVRKATGSPRYAELETLLSRLCPREARGVQALVKKINRFKRRNPSCLDEIEDLLRRYRSGPNK